MTARPLAFAELCAKSNFSRLEGASRPEEMIERARELGIAAIAIADAHGLYGSVRAHVAAKKSGMPFIVGAEVAVVRRRSSRPSPAAKVVLLAQTSTGYRNLCRVLTAAHAGLPRERSELELPQLAAHCEGLVCIARTPSEGALRRRDVTIELVAEVVGGAHEIFAERCFIATSRHFAVDSASREALANNLAARFAVPLIATADPIFHVPTRKPIADVLQCIREKTTVERAGNRLASNAEAYLHGPAQMGRTFRDVPERLALTVEIAESCRFSLGDLKYSFPCDDLLPGESPDDALRRLVRECSPLRYPGGLPVTVAQQIEKELGLIAKLSVAQFFLSVYEIVKIAREKRILCQGRGSAANSAVCFVLGITAVDPARSNLLFERFLSSERNEPPDIDVDFEHERREEVIQAIYEKYGRERAAMVSEVTCYRGKSALRETAKALGLSLEQADRLTHLVGPHEPIGVQAERLRELGFDPHDTRIRLVLQIATELQGFPRHMSTHVGGFVLSSAPLDEVSPTEPAKIPGRTVVPWDKDDIDALGFFKVDVLGLGMLTAIRKALELIHCEQGGDALGFDPIEAMAALPPEESTVYDAICRADTIGVFQIESRAQMAMLPRMKPRAFYDLVIEVAIVRPGPIQGGMVHPYLRRRSGQEPVSMPHPSLAPILDRTLGVPLFQEQVMQIAIVAGGYSAGEADELRRDMAAWRRSAKLLNHEKRLVNGFRQRGVAQEFAERLFSQIKGFGEYGFPESHASSFALLVYASAFIKTHHPLEFACALLNSQPMGFYSASSLVRDAQKHGVRVLGPDVTQSRWDCTIEDSADTPMAASDPEEATDDVSDVSRMRRESLAARALRLGLRLVKGIGEDVARRIDAARERGPLLDVKDLSVRAALRVDQMDALAEAGALESLVKGRRQAMWQARAPTAGRLFEQARPRETPVALASLAPVEQLLFDYARLALSVDDHPMRHLRARVKKRGAVTSEQLTLLRHGTPVTVGGLVLSRQRPQTASGVVFITMEDETGMINLILTPDVFERHRTSAAHARLLLVRGTLERNPREPAPGEHPVIHVLTKSIEVMHLHRAIDAASRDFR